MKSHSVSDMPLLRGPVTLSHMLVSRFLREGDTAIDATCGTGRDTLLLAELTGSTGHVWGFDIQEQAIAETRCKLTEAGLNGWVTLLSTGHEEMEKHVKGPVNAVLFNLGYLPGSDRSVITRPETTGAALAQSLELLGPGGIILVTVYPGHGGGAIERRVVDGWAAGLEARGYHSWRMGQVNVMSDAPYCILVQKAS